MDEPKATENEIEHEDETRRAERRDFLKKAGTVAVAAPAAALLLSAKTRPALAHNRSLRLRVVCPSPLARKELHLAVRLPLVRLEVRRGAEDCGLESRRARSVMPLHARVRGRVAR